jgi:integrase
MPGDCYAGYLTTMLPASFPNPGTELSEWIGKKRQKKVKRDIDWLPLDVGIALLRRCEDDYPRRYAFLCCAMLAGLRWGECVALQADDVEWDRGTIYVQRTWSEKAKVVNGLKDSDKRRVPLTKELRRALRRHVELMDAEAYKESVITFVDERGRKTERRVRLMFPRDTAVVRAPPSVRSYRSRSAASGSIRASCSRRPRARSVAPTKFSFLLLLGAPASRRLTGC